MLALVRFWADLRAGSIQLNSDDKPINIKPVSINDANLIFGSLVSKQVLYVNHMTLRLARMFGYDFASNLDADFSDLRIWVNTQKEFYHKKY